MALILAGCAQTETGASQEGAAKAEQPGLFAGLFSGQGGAAKRATASKTEDGARPNLPKPQERVSMAGGGVVIAGPDGYCVDPTTAITNAARGFALLASCHVLSEGEIGFPVEPILLTAALAPRADQDDLPSPEAIAATADAPLISGEQDGALVIAHLGTGGDRALPSGDPQHWRGMLVVNGRLVGLALYVPKGNPLAGKDGAVMIKSFAKAIQSASSQEAEG